MKESRLIGIAGAGRGTGATHLCIWMANYLSSCLLRRTAVLQWNSHGDFERAEGTLKGCPAGEDGSMYRFLDVTYLKMGDSCTLADCMDGTYEDIIIDFGEMREEIRAEWLRCKTRIITAALCEWKLEAFLEFLAGEERLRDGWMYMTAFGSEDIRKEIEHQFRICLVRIPLSVDAFSVDRRAMDWFKGILK